MMEGCVGGEACHGVAYYIEGVDAEEWYFLGPWKEHWVATCLPASVLTHPELVGRGSAPAVRARTTA